MRKNILLGLLGILLIVLLAAVLFKALTKEPEQPGASADDTHPVFTKEKIDRIERADEGGNKMQTMTFE